MTFFDKEKNERKGRLTEKVIFLNFKPKVGRGYQWPRLRTPFYPASDLYNRSLAIF